MNRTQRGVGAKDREWRRNFSFGQGCASIAPSLRPRLGRGYEKSTIENDQKRNRVTELAEITNDGRNRKGSGMGNDEKGRRRDWPASKGQST